MGLAGRHGAMGVNGRKIVFPFLVFDVDDALARIKHPMPGIAGGQHAIEHINAQCDALQQVFWRTDTHEVARFVGGQNIGDDLGHSVHIFGRLAHRKTADCIALAAVRGDGLGRDTPQFWIGTALNDREKGLFVAMYGFRRIETLDTAGQPTVRKAERVLSIFEIAGIRRTLIKGHDDVSANDALRIHHVFWGEMVARAINMALERDTFLLDFAAVRQRIYLIATTIGQDGALPSIEAMQAAHLSQRIEAGAQIKVISIAEDDLRSYVVYEFVLVYGLNGARRAHRHENGCLDSAVRSFDRGRTSAGIRVCML